MTNAVSKVIEDQRGRGGLKGTEVATIASVCCHGFIPDVPAMRQRYRHKLVWFENAHPWIRCWRRVRPEFVPAKYGLVTHWAARPDADNPHCTIDV